MKTPEEKLAELGLELKPLKQTVGNHISCVRTGNLLFTAGQGVEQYYGKLGRELTTEEGYLAAQEAMLNLLSAVKKEIGELSKVKQFVKVLAMVNSTNSFIEQPTVANGASDLLNKLFGEKGQHGRTAVGMAQLPHNIAIEIEMIVEVEDCVKDIQSSKRKCLEMETPEKRLEELGLELPPLYQSIGNYVNCVRTGNLLFTAGRGDKQYQGKLGRDLTLEEGSLAAQGAMLSLLSAVKMELGELSKIKRFVKLLVFVNSTEDFTEQPIVANGASDLLNKVFGEKGKHARSAVGMAQLAHNLAVVIEMIVEVED